MPLLLLLLMLLLLMSRHLHMYRIVIPKAHLFNVSMFGFRRARANRQSGGRPLHVANGRQSVDAFVEG